MKTLGFVIPCYGKDNDVVRQTMKSVIEALNVSDDAEVVFVYKNLNNFNYDWVSKEFTHQNLKYINVEDTSVKRNFKLLLGIKNINSKYIYPLDADDIINMDHFSKIIHYLKNQNNDVVIMDFIKKKGSDEKYIHFAKKAKKYNTFFPGNYVIIYKKEIINLENDLNDKFVWHHDIMFYANNVQNAKTLTYMEYALIKLVKLEESASTYQNYFKPDYLSYTKQCFDYLSKLNIDQKFYGSMFWIIWGLQITLNYSKIILKDSEKGLNKYYKLNSKYSTKSTMFWMLNFGMLIAAKYPIRWYYKYAK